jgi:hypothetical protein
MITKPVYVPSHRAGSIKEQYEELIDVSSDMNLKDTYIHEILLINFSAVVKKELPLNSSLYVEKLLMFPCTYLCETAIARYAAIKRYTEIGLMHNATWGCSFSELCRVLVPLWPTKRSTCCIREVEHKL